STKTSVLAVEDHHACVLSGSCVDAYRTTHLLSPADVLDDGGNAITPMHDAHHQRAVPCHTFLKTLAGNTSSPPVIPTAKRHDSSRRSHVVLEGCEEALKAETSLPALRRNSEREREPLLGGTRQCGQLGEGQVIIFMGAALREILLSYRSPAKIKTERTLQRGWSLSTELFGAERSREGNQRDKRNVEDTAGVCKTDSQPNGTNVQPKQFRLAVGLRGTDKGQERVGRRVDGSRATPTQSDRGNPCSVNGR
ncbi:hypothetical protein C8J57DRAFT_1577973, partial [Mycena rebaudengoi]